jgi:ribonuclease HI/uncharacterized phage-like protein YoqJ
MTSVIYTDGACSGNPGPGGWAWAIPGGRYASGADKHTTNQRMEVNAVLNALQTIEGPVEIVSDSTYVINCFRDRWWEGWLKRGWLNSQKKPVANRDLWEPLIELVNARKDVTFTWVKGHSGDQMNDLVDSLAVEAGKTQKPKTGDGVPKVDKTATTKGPHAPDGRILLVTGPRPPQIGGYGPNPTASKIKDQLHKIIVAKAEMSPDLKVMTGLGLGVEQIVATVAIEAHVPFVAVLAYPNQDSIWPDGAKREYAGLLEQAESEIVMQATSPATKQAAGAALTRRTAWMAKAANEAIVVWDGHEPKLERVVHLLQDQLGEDEVWLVSIN